MLILTRCPNEAIWIGDNIKIVYMGINPYAISRKDAISLGIIAPKGIEVVREELFYTHRSDKK